MKTLGRNAEYGRDFKTLSIIVSPEEHRDFKRRAVDFGVTISDVARHALASDEIWRQVQQLKEKEDRQ